MISSKFIFSIATMLISISSSPAMADAVLKNRLDCIESLGPFTQKGSSTSFKFLENIKAMNLKEFSSALIGIDKRKNLMTLPTTRSGVRGFYLFSDEGSFWYPLPKLKKKGEFLPQYLKVENNLISKSPLYLTYYDGVESTGAEYSNKSISLSLNKTTTDGSVTYTDMPIVGIKDSESETAFLNNFKGMLSTIPAVHERYAERRNPKEKKDFAEKFNAAINKCSDLFKQTSDKDYLELTNATIAEFKTGEAVKSPGPSAGIPK